MKVVESGLSAWGCRVSVVVLRCDGSFFSGSRGRGFFS